MLMQKNGKCNFRPGGAPGQVRSRPGGAPGRFRGVQIHPGAAPGRDLTHPGAPPGRKLYVLFYQATLDKNTNCIFCNVDTINVKNAIRVR